jgi:hypothetical protein
MPSRCSRLNQNYQALLVLQGRFSEELEQAMVTGDFSGVALLKAEITEKKQTLEGEINPFETALKIREQYETQKRIYENIGLLEKREGVLGMEGIDGKWYAFPSLSEVHKRFREKKEMLDIKTDQGFEKLLIVPFGMSLEKFTETMKKTLLDHFEGTTRDPADMNIVMPDPKTRLFGANKDKTREALRLNTKEPLCTWDKYADADTAGTLVYFPQVFDEDAKIHKGKTKQQLLEETGQGFQLLLIEKNPIIPAAGTDEFIGTKQPRKRLEANSAPKAYLETLQTQPEYSNEHGMTPEAWMTHFLLQLEGTDQVIDDWQGNGKVNVNLGGWFQLTAVSRAGSGLVAMPGRACPRASRGIGVRIVGRGPW